MVFGKGIISRRCFNIGLNVVAYTNILSESVNHAGQLWLNWKHVATEVHYHFITSMSGHLLFGVLRLQVSKDEDPYSSFKNTHHTIV